MMIHKLKDKVAWLKSSKEATSFIKKLSGFSLGPVLNGLLGLVTVPLLTWFISSDEMGRASMYFTGQSLTTLLVLLGLDQVVIRNFHKYSNQKSLLFNSFLPSSIFCIIAILIGFFLRQPLSFLLFNELNLVALAFFLASIVVAIFRRYTSIYIRMNERAKTYSILQVAFKILYTAFLIASFILIETSYTIVIASHFCAVLCTFLIELVYVVKNKLIKGKFIFSKKTILKGFHFGLPLALAAGMFWINNSFDKVALRQLSTFEEIGIYNVAFNFSNVMNIVKLAFTTFWIPVAYKWYNEGVNIKRFQKVNDLMVGGLCFLGLGAFLFRGVLYYLINESYFEAISVFPFLLLVPLLYTSSEIVSVGINLKKKTIYALYSTTLSAGVNIGLNYLLIPSLGAKGAAIATAASFLVFFLARSFFSNKIWGPIKIRYNVMGFLFLFFMYLIFA